MTVEEARTARVCRICEQPIPRFIGAMKGAEFEFGAAIFPIKITYNFGDEFAHTDCLTKEQRKDNEGSKL